MLISSWHELLQHHSLDKESIRVEKLSERIWTIWQSAKMIQYHKNLKREVIQ